jgi:glycosyltransferase involved in cell wall biosynthesis
MRIAFLTSLFMPQLGGAEIFLHHLVKDLTCRGHRCVVIAPRSRKYRHAFQMTYPHVRALRARSKRFLAGNALPSLMAAHLLHRFDLVHCQGEYHETIAARHFNRLTGVPYVCRPVGGGFTNIEGYPRLQQKLSRALSRVELMFAQGAFLHQRIQSFGIADTKIVTIHNGVRIDEIRRFESHQPVVDPPYLLYAGGLKPVKGYDIAVKAFGQIADIFPDLKLVVLGIDQKKKAFDALVSQMGLADRVRYLYYCDRPATMTLFCHAEIYLCPFHRSPFSNANLESLAAGAPIIATAVEGNIEQIRDGVEGFLIPPGNHEAMAQKIKIILSDSALQQRLRHNAVSRSHDFEWSRMVDRYEEHYRQVLGRKAGP